MSYFYLKEIAHGRSGDKGDISNICIFARKPENYEFLVDFLTVQRVKEHFGEMVKGKIVRYEVPSLAGLNFVMDKALGGGATLSLRQDTLGKSMSSALMRIKVEKNIYQSYKK